MDIEKNIRELLMQAADLLAQALTATEEGNDEEAATFEEQSDELKGRAEKLKTLLEKQKAFNVPTLPAPLPVGASASNGTTLTGVPPTATKTITEMNDEELQNEIQQNLYLTRFGETPQAVKAVLLDLHGKEYEMKRAAQWNAFLTYMRGREHTLKANDFALLREVILTPAMALKAISEGWDIKNLKATMIEASDVLGGYIVPVDFQSRVLERLQGETVMRGRAQQENTSRDRIQFPTATGGDDQFTSAIREFWVDETPTSSAAETNLTFGLETIPIHTAMSLVPLSKNLLEDAAFDLASYMVRKFSEAAAINEDNTFLIGDGAGKPQGLLPGSANGVGLTEINSTAAATLEFDGILALTFGIAKQYRNKAVYIARRSTYEVISKLKDGDGAYLWTEFRGDNVTGTPEKLRGYPILEQEAMPAVAANSFPILFGDPEAYMVVDRVGMSVQRYDVNPGENIVKYEMRRRLGGQPVETYRMAVQKVAV